MNHRATSACSDGFPVIAGADGKKLDSKISPATTARTSLAADRVIKKIVYLHIGWEKTGSSAIQAFCGRNQKWLSQQGFDYPLFGTAPQHIALYWELENKQPRRIDRMLRKIQGVIASSPHPAMIFSHESLHLCNPQVLRQIFDGVDIRVIAYIRRPDTAAISHFVTMIRFGYLPASNLLKAIRMYTRQHLTCYDYFWQLESFATVFGRENIIVRLYSRDQLVGGQSVSDFMHILGIDNLTGSSWPQARANLSMDIDQLAFVLRCARLLRNLPTPQIRKFTKNICDAILEKSTKDHNRSVELFVSATLKKRINTFFQPSLDLLYKRFFDDRIIFDPTFQDALEYKIHNPDQLDEFREYLVQAGNIPSPILDQLNLFNKPFESVRTKEDSDQLGEFRGCATDPGISHVML